jgi:shikimate kinase
MNLILCGMMGAGKTTVAKALAKLTGYQSYDTDAEIVKKHGNISDIFARFGEEYFRDLETQTVKELVNEQNAIISVGGGLVLRQENVEILKTRKAGAK